MSNKKIYVVFSTKIGLSTVREFGSHERAGAFLVEPIESAINQRVRLDKNYDKGNHDIDDKGRIKLYVGFTIDDNGGLADKGLPVEKLAEGLLDNVRSKFGVLVRVEQAKLR